MHNFKLQKLTI